MKFCETWQDENVFFSQYSECVLSTRSALGIDVLRRRVRLEEWKIVAKYGRRGWCEIRGRAWKFSGTRPLSLGARALTWRPRPLSLGAVHSRSAPAPAWRPRRPISLGARSLSRSRSAHALSIENGGWVSLSPEGKKTIQCQL